MTILLYIMSAMLISSVEIFSYHKIVNQQIKFTSLKLYLVYLFQTILIIINYTFTNNIIKVFLTFAIMFISCKILFNKMKIANCFLIIFISELIVIISELLFMIIMGLFIKVTNNILAIIFEGTLFANIVIVLITISILFTNLPSKIYKKIINLVHNVKINITIIFFSFVLLCGSILFYISYYNTNKFFTLIVNFIITIIYFVIVIMILIKEHKYNIINTKYCLTLNELEEYENIVNEYRIINHENENQLYSIKGLTKNKKVLEYIDEILDNKNAKNKIILNQALLIPTGGLRGLIYSKLLVMKNKNINYKINVDRKVNNRLMKSISTKEMVDICQIIGVYLDNAIEAVENLKNKNIIINIYKTELLVIEIINNIKTNFDINRIDKVGYTTKEGIHGYGLSLVNKILKENKDFTNEREISKNIFKQKLLIKIK